MSSIADAGLHSLSPIGDDNSFHMHAALLCWTAAAVGARFSQIACDSDALFGAARHSKHEQQLHHNVIVSKPPAHSAQLAAAEV